MILGGTPLACVKCFANTVTWNSLTREENWTTSVECKTVITVVLTVMRDLDPHMISWVVVMVLVQGVLDGCGYGSDTGSTRWLWFWL